MAKKTRKALLIALLAPCSIFWFFHISFASGPVVLGTINKDDKILILAPHPDDEAIACSGIIQEALKKKAQVQIIYLTNGDNNELAFIVYEKRLVFRKSEFIHMGELRRKEAIEALGYLGLSLDNLVFLGYPDSGTSAMFTQFWQSKKPFKNPLTRINKVPYPENFSYQADYYPENILLDLESLIEAYRPNKIFVSHPADHNPDHRAFSIFLSVGLWDLEQRIPKPKVYNYLVHHLYWPFPLRYHPQLSLYPPEDLEDTGGWFSFELSKDALTKKHNAILYYKTQTRSSAFYLLAFARKNELFQELPLFNLSNGKMAAVSRFVRYAQKDKELNVVFKKPPEKRNVYRFNLYLFGWRRDTLFSKMPKIFLAVRSRQVIIFDGKKRLKLQGISQEIDRQNITIKIPLEVLSNPERLLVSARIFSKNIPYTQGIWSGMELK